MDDEDCKENQTVTFLDGTTLPSIPYLGESDPHQGRYPENEPCHDCRCLPGKFHHPGCDMEVCPRCKGQAIVCDCFNDDRVEEEQKGEVEVIEGVFATSRRWRRERREEFRAVLKVDVEYRRFYRKGYTCLYNAFLPVDFNNFSLFDLLAKKCVEPRDVVQCPTAYLGTELIPGAVSLWGKIPKVIVQKSEKTFDVATTDPGKSYKARWTVWYEGHTHIKGYALTKGRAIYALERRHSGVRWNNRSQRGV